MQDFYQNSAIWSDGSTHHLNIDFMEKRYRAKTKGVC